MKTLNNIETSYDVLSLLAKTLRANDSLDVYIKQGDKYGYIIYIDEDESKNIVIKIKNNRLEDLSLVENNSLTFIALYDNILNNLKELIYDDEIVDETIVID